MNDELARHLPGVVATFIPIMAIFGSFMVAIFFMYFGMRRREILHRERMAMIEKGLVPPQVELEAPNPEARADRSRRGGIVLIGIGLGVGTFFGSIGLLNNERDAIGFGMAAGGMLVLIGAAMLVNAFIDKGKAARSQQTQ